MAFASLANALVLLDACGYSGVLAGTHEHSIITKMTDRWLSVAVGGIICWLYQMREGAREVVFDQMSAALANLSFVDIFNLCVFLTFTICYTYQLFYVFVVLTRRAPRHKGGGR